jgi:hypothetical protein
VGECVVLVGWVEELEDFTRDSSGEKILDTGRPRRGEGRGNTGHNQKDINRRE